MNYLYIWLVVLNGIITRHVPIKLDNATMHLFNRILSIYGWEYLTRYSCPLLLSDQIDNTNYFSSKKKVDSDCPKVRKLDSEKKWFVLNYLFLTLFGRFIDHKKNVRDSSLVLPQN